MELKVMTFNIQHCKNFLTKDIDISGIVNIIKENNIDVVGLNEVMNEGPIYFNQAKKIADELNYYYYFGEAINYKGHPYGNAILSKTPLREMEVIKINDPIEKTEGLFYESRCIIKAKYQDINILVSHFGLVYEEGINAIDTILNEIEDMDKVILMGDFNMTPNDERLEILNNSMMDTSVFLSTPQNTFPSNNPERKIDYIYVSNLTVKDAKVINKIVSDHYPYMTILDI